MWYTIGMTQTETEIRATDTDYAAGSLIGIVTPATYPAGHYIAYSFNFNDHTTDRPARIALPGTHRTAEIAEQWVRARYHRWVATQ